MQITASLLITHRALTDFARRSVEISTHSSMNKIQYKRFTLSHETYLLLLSSQPQNSRTFCSSTAFCACEMNDAIRLSNCRKKLSSESSLQFILQRKWTYSGLHGQNTRIVQVYCKGLVCYYSFCALVSILRFLRNRKTNSFTHTVHRYVMRMNLLFQSVIQCE